MSFKRTPGPLPPRLIKAGDVRADMRLYVRRVYGASLVGLPIPMPGGVWRAVIQDHPHGPTRIVQIPHAELHRLTSNDPGRSKALKRYVRIPRTPAQVKRVRQAVRLKHAAWVAKQSPAFRRFLKAGGNPDEWDLKTDRRSQVRAVPAYVVHHPKRHPARSFLYVGVKKKGAAHEHAVQLAKRHGRNVPLSVLSPTKGPKRFEITSTGRWLPAPRRKVSASERRKPRRSARDPGGPRFELPVEMPPRERPTPKRDPKRVSVGLGYVVQVWSYNLGEWLDTDSISRSKKNALAKLEYLRWNHPRVYRIHRVRTKTLYASRRNRYARDPWRDRLKGGLADRLTPRDVSPSALRLGASVEREHTSDRHLAREIAMDHLVEDPLYYRKLARMEGKGRRRRGRHGHARVAKSRRTLARKRSRDPVSHVQARLARARTKARVQKLKTVWPKLHKRTKIESDRYEVVVDGVVVGHVKATWLGAAERLAKLKFGPRAFVWVETRGKPTTVGQKRWSGR